MSASVGEDGATSYKEIYIKHSSDVWNDIVLNTGGIPSTLQDLKAQQKSGGYVYRKLRNRFIYWRTDHDVLELVEESLDINLTDNQVRYKFVGSRVLDGISVTETFNSVVILVPTISSVHRLTFKHPEKLMKQNTKQLSAQSIFFEANEADVMDAKTYHVLGASMSAVLTGASCLSHNNDAVFALSLANSSILLVNMDPLSGTATSAILNHESLMPRFLSGLTEAFLRNKEANNNVSVSMVLHHINRELYLFSLEREGKLRVWSCDRTICVMATNIADGVDNKLLKGQNHKLCKGVGSDGEFILCAHLQGSTVVALQPTFETGVFQFTTLCHASPPPGLEMIDMAFGGGGNIWCSWLTGKELPSVSKIKLPHAVWFNVSLAKPALEIVPSSYVNLDPAQMYLDAIFSSGFFTSADVAKAVSIYRTSAVVDMNMDIREQICAIVEAEIYGEVCEAVVDDDEYVEISQRCWSRLYSCCTQYLLLGTAPIGMFWLPSASTLVLIKHHGFSLVREMMDLECLCLTPLSMISPTKEYGPLVNSLRLVNMDAGIERLELALHLGKSLELPLEEAVSLVPQSAELDEVITLLSDDAIKASLSSLTEELFFPEDFSRTGPDGEAFCSDSGTGAVVSTFADLCSLRLRLCEKILLLLKISNDLLPSFCQTFTTLCKAYYCLHWTCISNVNVDTSLIQAFAAANPTLMQPSIMESVFSLANALWPINDTNLLPQHLLTTKQYVYLETLSRIMEPYSWTMLLAQGYLECGEGYKAYDLIVNQVSEVEVYLKAASMFDLHRRSDLVIAIACRALNLASPTSAERETLCSLMFLHELQLGHYDLAYGWVEANPDTSGKADCLHRLIVDMLNNYKLQELLSFHYSGLLDQVEKILENRARTLNITASSIYYNLLYALHIKHENYKKAARVMFEQGLRADTPEMQWQCFGTCLNALMLVAPDEAWIVRPTGAINPDEDSVEVLEVSDIRRDYEIAGARYNLGDCPIDTSPVEVITMCISNGHFKTALRLANLCKISSVTAVETFTAECVALREPGAPWQWVRHNEIYDYLVSEDNAKVMAWRILEHLIMKYEKPHETVLHRACANKLMELAYYLPSWLLISYKKRNAAELLRLYLSYGDLVQASNLACEYIKASMGAGKEHFGMETSILSTAPPIWLPLNTIDLLRLELKENNMGDELEAVLKNYIETAKRVSLDKMNAFLKQSCRL